MGAETLRWLGAFLTGVATGALGMWLVVLIANADQPRFRK